MEPSSSPLHPCLRRARPCRVHRRYVVIDLETTGFDPRTEAVVEMACVTIDRGRVVDTWSTLVDPARPIPRRATRVHGIRGEDVAGAPTYDAALADLLARCGDATPVAHNAAFDRAFLPRLHDRRWLCTIALARRAFPEAPSFGNQTLRRWLAIHDAQVRPGGERIVPHRALDDALVTAQILVRCLERDARARDEARRADAPMFDLGMVTPG